MDDGQTLGKWERKMGYLAYASLWVLALSLFTSFSFSALHHLLLLPAGLFFFFQQGRAKGLPLGVSAYSLLALVILGILSLWSNLNVDLLFPDFLRKTLKLKYFLFGVLGIFAFEGALRSVLDQKKIRLLIHGILISTSVATLSGLIGLWTQWNPLRFKGACHLTRNCGMYGMYMTYGYGIGLFMVLATGLILYRDRIRPYCHLPLLYAAWIINGLGLWFSYTRGALLGFLVAIPFFFFKKNKKIFIGVGVSLLLGGGVLLIANEKVQDMFLSKQRLQSNSVRWSQFQAAIYGISDRPLLGWGFKNFEPNSVKIKKRYGIDNENFTGHAHNNFMEHLGSTGLLGLLAFMIFSFFWIFETYRRNDLIGQLVFPLTIAFLVSGQFQYTFGDGENLFLLMLFYSLSQVAVPIKSPSLINH